jgi:hypothetical protein
MHVPTLPTAENVFFTQGRQKSNQTAPFEQ